ncbi:uncharacterized protein LOC143896984 isoform X2 [Temnothorax americanus]|uniref:uncharacterized protein LOC143896984 isoform X2 n=1 Tax=Temnothorax americanus TaxID=1964332 RepID=UPI004067C01E
MCSHETVAWEITDNFVADRMIDNSLIHKLRPSRKIRRSTKALNAEIRKHCGVKDYRHYTELKTGVLRNLAHDTDTGNSSSLTDVDYDIIYSSPSKRAKYVAKNSVRYSFTSEEECKGYKKTSVKAKSGGRSTERRVQTRKSPQVKYTKKCIDVGWQEVTKKSGSTSHLRTNILDNEGMVLKDNDYCHFMTESSKQSLSPRLRSQNSTSRTMKYINEHMRQNHEDTNAVKNKLSSKNNTISNKTKSVRGKKVQNNKNQNATMNESNTTFNSHDSHRQPSLSRSTLENSNDFDNETNTLVQSEDNDGNELTSNGSSMNTKSYGNTCANHKSELLKNVKRNLVLVLEKIDTTNNNKDIETHKSLKDRSNNDQLLPATISLDRHSTSLRNTGPNMPEINDLSSDTSLLDHQKDSGIDEDSQDRIVKIKRSNKIATSRNIEENAEKISISPELKKNDEVIETAKDCKEAEKDVHLKFSNEILRDQISKKEKEPSREEKMKNSSQTIQSDINMDINQEDKEDEHFAKTEHSNNIQNQQLLHPKRDCMKNANSEPCNHIQTEEDHRKVRKSSEEEEISLELNKIDKDTEVFSINCEGEGKRQTDEDKEEKNFPQLNKTDKDAKTHLINQEDKICMNLDNTHDVQKQQILPKVMHTEILHKKYKIINKKDNDVKSDIETIDNININTDITNKCAPMKKHTLIHCLDVINQNTDNWQDAAINAEEIDAPIGLETDNEETNVSYVSPQTKKRLQQQARLNLVVSSDSSESDNEYVTAKTSRKHIDTSDTSRCSEDDRNDETNHAFKQTDISHNENIYIPKKAIVPTEVAKLESTNMKEGIKKKAESLMKCTYENNDLIQSTANENLLKETQYCENVHNDDRSKDDSFQLRVSENNVLCNNGKSVTQVEGHKHSPLLNKKNMYTKSNANEEIVRTEFGTRHKSEHERSVRASTNFCSDTHLNISYEYRPCNLQELVEDQGLLMETMPANFTLADLSSDEEAFILNVPSKVIQCNLQDQVLTLKEKSIKFGESKYRIVRKEVGTTSCIFATGKKRTPYKIINIKKISTITVREKLPRDSRNTEVSNSYPTVSSVLKPIKMNNRQTDEADSKMMEVSNHKKRKRRESSGEHNRRYNARRFTTPATRPRPCNLHSS